MHSGATFSASASSAAFDLTNFAARDVPRAISQSACVHEVCETAAEINSAYGDQSNACFEIAASFLRRVCSSVCSRPPEGEKVHAPLLIIARALIGKVVSLLIVKIQIKQLPIDCNSHA